MRGVAMSALVVEVDRGASLIWVEGGKLWRADRLCRDGGFTPWRLVDDAPGVGGQVLTDAEVSRLVAPLGCGVSR